MSSVVLDVISRCEQQNKFQSKVYSTAQKLKTAIVETFIECSTYIYADLSEKYIIPFRYLGIGCDVPQ